MMAIRTVLDRLSFALLVASFAAAGASLPAQDLGGNGLKENLDLPLDALGESGEGEDDPPEVVNFYGQTLEGDGFFYCIDRSGSMLDSGELGRAKQEVSRNISEFSEKTQFGVAFFDAGILKFPTSGRPVEASPAMKGAGLAFVANTSGGAGSCVIAGLRECLRFANVCPAKRKVIVYVGDGGGHCMGQDEMSYLRTMVPTVTSQNYQRVIINTIGVLMGSSRGQYEALLKQLAQSNGGTYRRIN